MQTYETTWPSSLIFPISSIIVSMTKFSIFTGSVHAYSKWSNKRPYSNKHLVSNKCHPRGVQFVLLDAPSYKHPMSNRSRPPPPQKKKKIASKAKETLQRVTSSNCTLFNLKFKVRIELWLLSPCFTIKKANNSKVVDPDDNDDISRLAYYMHSLD